MDDIVKRIRQQSYFGFEPYEAADEIEQLRQRVQELEKQRDDFRRDAAEFSGQVSRLVDHNNNLVNHREELILEITRIKRGDFSNERIENDSLKLCINVQNGQIEKLTAERDELLAALESNQSRGVRDVIVERRRQINIEGWSSHHDDQHSYGEMALAAGCYAMFGLCFNAGDPPKYWPWDKKWWKPSDKRRNLVKAAALIIADIERIDRAAIASVKEKA